MPVSICICEARLGDTVGNRGYEFIRKQKKGMLWEAYG